MSYKQFEMHFSKPVKFLQSYYQMYATNSCDLRRKITKQATHMISITTVAYLGLSGSSKLRPQNLTNPSRLQVATTHKSGDIVKLVIG